MTRPTLGNLKLRYVVQDGCRCSRTVCDECGGPIKAPHYWLDDQDGGKFSLCKVCGDIRATFKALAG